MSRKVKIIISVISFIFIFGVVGIYLFLQSIPEFWTSQGKIEKELTHTLMLISFHIDKEAQYPHSMDLTMNGEIDGVGILSFGWSDTVFYRTDTIIDNFRIDYNADWYSDTCFVRFIPIEMTNGNLTIDYKVHSSRK
jgi:hypothetical protein